MAWLWIWLSVSLGADKITFPVGTISVAGKNLVVEVADTPERTSRGLMFRKTLAENAGMIFVFSDESQRSFWMKNTFIPLSIGFFGKDRVLRETLDMRPAKSELEAAPPSYFSKVTATYALEVNQGWFQRNKIKVGDRFDWVSKPRP